MNNHLLLKHRYLILSLCLFIIALVQFKFGLLWDEDLYEHVSVVRELAIHPFSPNNPRFLSTAPHAFFSPYLLIIGLIVRITGLNPITVIWIAGIFNITLFLFSFKFFIDSIFTDRNVSFYSLLLILLFWGSYPWEWSSFFSLQIFFRVLSYPSFFAMAATLLCLTIYLKILKGEIGKLYFILILFFSTIILITHPFTALFLLTGFIAFSIGSYKSTTTINYLLLFLVLVTSFILTCSWPYFPFIKLFYANSNEFNLDSRPLYNNVLMRIFPCLISLPLIGKKIKLKLTDPLVLIFFGLCILYFYGFISGKYAYGRVISYIVIILQIFIAEWLAALEAKYHSGKLSESGRMIFLIPVIAFICYILVINLIRQGHAYIIIIRSPKDYKQLTFLSKHVSQYDLILSDIHTSWVIPAIEGKVIVAKHAEAFIPDSKIRREDINKFFSNNSSPEERIAIIKKYNPKYILLNKDRAKSFDHLLLFCKSIGDKIYSDNKFVLIKLDHNVL